MSRATYFLHPLVFCIVFWSSALSQEEKNPYGIGVNFGGAIPMTDIDEHRDFPFGRAFLRYSPGERAALEFGFGLGSLEADGNNKFFSSVIYTIDIRLLLTPFKQGKMFPYLFGGVGLMYFDPSDRNDQPLARNANNEYSHMTGYFPVGIGWQYFITELTAM